MEAVPLATVLARPDVWCGGRFADAALPAVGSGHEALDRELPGGGWPRGALTELLCDGAGQGEIALLLPALKRLCAEDGWLVLIAPPFPLHAGAWAAAGIPLERLLVVEPQSNISNTSNKGRIGSNPGNGRMHPDANKRAHLDVLWTAEQALNSDAPSAVLCWSMQAEGKSVRRLQLAAATSHAASFLIRPTRAATQASAAPLRLMVSAHRADQGGMGELSIDILKRRGPPLAQPLRLALPRPAPWRSHEYTERPHPITSLATHGNALVRPLPAATAARQSSSPALG